MEQATPSVHNSIARLHRRAPGSIGDLMEFRVLLEDRERETYTFSCRTLPWMCNSQGTLHGGMGAAVADQAMGFVAYSYLAEKGTASTIQMSVNYHRPIAAGAEVLVEVRVVSRSRSLLTMTFEVWQADTPKKRCLTGSGTCFLKIPVE